MEGLSARELRIGNRLLNINNKQIVKVRQIRFGELLEVYHTDKITGYITLEYLQPIPLTKEILLKCGFYQQSFFGAKINYFVKDNVVFSLIDRQIEFDKPNIYVCKCEYLHELQNIYWCLCKKELDIEL